MYLLEPSLGLDLTGKNIDNLIIDEPHTLSSAMFRVIVPNKGIFFSESVTMKDGGRALVRGKDFQTVTIHKKVTSMADSEVCCIIVITNPEVQNDVKVTYQAVGGEYEYSFVAARNMYESVINDTRKIDWNTGLLNKPLQFEPVQHPHPIQDVYGWGDVVFELERIAQNILMKDAGSILDLVRMLLNDVRCGDLPRILPSRRIVQADELMYFLTRRKIISEAWVDTNTCTWVEGQTALIFIDTSDLEKDQRVRWVLYKEDDVGLNNVHVQSSGYVLGNEGIVIVPVHIPIPNKPVTDKFYIGINTVDFMLEFSATSYRVNIEKPRELKSNVSDTLFVRGVDSDSVSISELFVTDDVNQAKFTMDHTSLFDLRYSLTEKIDII